MVYTASIFRTGGIGYVYSQNRITFQINSPVARCSRLTNPYYAWYLPRKMLTPKLLQEAYVNHRKEDKLRALGVDEHIPRNSPTLSVMSRQGSSQSSAVLASPALASSPHVGPFPPSFYGAANPASYIGKAGIPQYSMAYAFHDPRLLSASQFPRPSEPPIPGTCSPPIYFASQPGSRAGSPQISGHVQAFAHAAPSVSPIGIKKVGQAPNQASSDLLVRTREQQAMLQIQQLEQQQQQQRQHHHHQQPVLQQRSLPSMGNFQSVGRILQPVTHHNQVEVIDMVPRDHRQKPNEILQKGVDESKACVSYSMDGNERQECFKATQVDKDYDAYRTKTNSSNEGRGDPQRARADRSLLDPSLSAKGVADPVTTHPGQSQSRYSSKASRFNVNAPKFEPRKNRTSGTFSFLGNKQAHKATVNESLSLSNSDAAVQVPNGASQPSKLNVAAPEFMPQFSVRATIPSREFNFSALRPSLRPDAPAFEPSDSRNASSREPNSEQNAVQPAKKIFGDINFSNVTKPPKSKAVLITRASKEPESQSKFDENLEGQEDESGRITQADGRQKRIRYVDWNIHLNIRDSSLRRETWLKVRTELLHSLRYLNWSYDSFLFYGNGLLEHSPYNTSTIKAPKNCLTT